MKLDWAILQNRTANNWKITKMGSKKGKKWSELQWKCKHISCIYYEWNKEGNVNFLCCVWTFCLTTLSKTNQWMGWIKYTPIHLRCTDPTLPIVSPTMWVASGSGTGEPQVDLTIDSPFPVFATTQCSEEPWGESRADLITDSLLPSVCHHPM